VGVKAWIIRIGGVALFVLGSAAFLWADDGHVVEPPRLTAGAPLPSSQLPAQADTAPAPAPPKPADPPAAVIHLVVPPAAAPAPQAQTVTLHVVAAPAAAVTAPSAPSTILAEIRHPGPVRIALGNFGERLAELKRDRLVLPASSATATPVVVQLVQAPPATALSPPAQAVLATPQAPSKSSFHFLRR
jgi:hypothetical protein